jgi:hypothetical protein
MRKLSTSRVPDCTQSTEKISDSGDQLNKTDSGIGFDDLLEAFWYGLYNKEEVRLENMIESVGSEVFLRVVAMVNCGLGIRCYEWVRANLSMVLVNVQNKSILGGRGLLRKLRDA